MTEGKTLLTKKYKKHYIEDLSFKNFKKKNKIVTVIFKVVENNQIFVLKKRF